MEEQKCPNCFAGNIASGMCTVCGFDRQDEKQSHMRLPEMYLLEDRYLIGRVLGCGGFGITYKAFDILNQCFCAIKEFVPLGLVAREEDGIRLSVTSRSNLEDFEHGKKRFMEESEVLRQLTDVPEVVKVTDYFTQNDTAYFVMEYLEGATLKQLMASFGGKIPLSDALPMIRCAGLALDQVHKRAGIFHRDISPDNIMVNQSGRIKLIDFGSAKHIFGKGNQTLTPILKHGYAPPEQYSSTGSQGSYTDVYALAATFYHIVTGIRLPSAPDRFGGETYRPLKEIEPAVSAEVSEAVDRALVLNSKQRTQSAAEFVSAFFGQQGMQKKPYLKIAGEAGISWNIPENKSVMIGRSGEWSDIVPTKNERISKKHCELFCDSIEKCFYLVDHSKNGTFIGSMRLEKGKAYVLKDREQFSLGNHILDLEVGWKGA